MQHEEWRSISDFPNYEISSLGNIRYKGKTKNRKQILSRQGYFRINLRSCHYSKIRSVRIARLVALAFLPINLTRPYVNHKNGIKTDNRVENLEWCSAKENTIHAITHGLHSSTKANKAIGERHGNAKLTNDLVRQFRAVYATGVSISHIAHQHNVSRTAVRHVVMGRRWKHVQ